MGKETSALEGYKSLDASWNTDDIRLYGPYCGFQVVITNTNAVGEVYLEGSIDRSNWSRIYVADQDGTPQDGYDVLSGQSFSHMFDLITALPWVRLSYAKTSGTGGLTYYINKKG